VSGHPQHFGVSPLDYDIVYGGHISAKDKVLITPDKRLKNYKQTLKGI